jgi:hypothetical protein
MHYTQKKCFFPTCEFFFFFFFFSVKHISQCLSIWAKVSSSSLSLVGKANVSGGRDSAAAAAAADHPPTHHTRDAKTHVPLYKAF